MAPLEKELSGLAPLVLKQKEKVFIPTISNVGRRKTLIIYHTAIEAVSSFSEFVHIIFGLIPQQAFKSWPLLCLVQVLSIDLKSFYSYGQRK